MTLCAKNSTLRCRVARIRESILPLIKRNSLFLRQSATHRDSLPSAVRTPNERSSDNMSKYPLTKTLFRTKDSENVLLPCDSAVSFKQTPSPLKGVTLSPSNCGFRRSRRRDFDVRRDCYVVLRATWSPGRYGRLAVGNSATSAPSRDRDLHSSRPALSAFCPLDFGV